MHLLLDAECPLFSEDATSHLHAVLRGVASGRHTIVNPNPDALYKLVGHSDWGVYGEAITQGFKSAVYASSLQRPDECTACVPRVLADYLASDVILLVENATTDGGFIELVARLLNRPVYSRIAGAHATVAVTHGGGIGELKKELSRIAALRARLRVGGLPPRIVVVTDSDSRSPGTVDRAAAEVKEEAERVGADFHILEKRSIENYVPDEALRRYVEVRADRSAAVTIILGLPPVARDHYPLKTGLPAATLPSAEDESLYPSGTPREAGLGNFMADFLQHAGRHMTAPDLKIRDRSADLVRLLATVERNI